MKTASRLSLVARLPRLPRRSRCALLLLTATAACATLVRANVPGGASSDADQSPPTAKPLYTDGGTTTVTVNNSSYNTGGPYSPNNFGPNRFDGFGDRGFLPGANLGPREVTIYHRPIYFPPDPPALGEPVKRRDPVVLGRFAPPATLANYVYEPFYAPLSTLLFTEDLSRKRRERLDAYRTIRDALLAELRARLETLRAADAPTRERELTALAGAQAPRLAALETAAEDLRFNFSHGGFFESSADWNDTRGWRLGDDTRWESQLDEIKVLRGAAGFQDGLSAAQRRLAREIAMELIDSLHGPTAEISLDSPGPFLYFSPATARIRLPADLPAELTARIDAYSRAKAALKSELRETLYAQDRAWFNYKRVNSFKALAEKQAAPLAALEQQAEEIRRALVAYPNPAHPPALPLPPALATRVHAYNQAKVAFQNRLIAKLEETRTALPEDRVEYTRASGAYALEIIPNRKSSPTQVSRRQATLASLPAFNEEATREYARLAREKESIRIDVLHAVGAISARSVGKGIEQLLKEFAFAFQKQEAWERYREYETAVLEPGLSPAQRTLLFGAALEKLELPLAN